MQAHSPFDIIARLFAAGTIASTVALVACNVSASPPEESAVEELNCGDWEGGFRSSREVRKHTRERMRVTWRAMGADAEAVKVLDAIAIRESSGDPCARHTLGKGEDGWGPMGLFFRWHRGKWWSDPAGADPRTFQIPEVSAIIALRIFRRAVSRHGAETWGDAAEVFGSGKLKRDRPVQRHNFAHRLSRRGLDANGPITKLGSKLGTGPTEDQAEFLAGLLGS